MSQSLSVKSKNNFSTKDLFKLWGQVALNSFGGPAGQIAVIHKLVVEDKKIISEKKFLHALNFCMLLPGPEAQQLATYMGFLMGKWRGGLIAGGLFILPGFLSILLLSYLYVLYKNHQLIVGLFYGIKPAIISIVLAALYKISKKSLNSKFSWTLAFLSFVLLFCFKFPFPYIVLGSGLTGILSGLFGNYELQGEENDSHLPRLSQTFKTILSWLFIWFLPIGVCFLFLPKDSTLNTINLFFSKMSLVTFGGAYAALSYVAQQGVEIYNWLTAEEMLNGLALAETTPGPLIQVVQYVGFMASYRFPGSFNPLISSFIGSVLTTWMTFAPCFLFIFTFTPYVEFIREKKILRDALNAITASIVGVILNLSLWFILETLFSESQKINIPYTNFRLPLASSIDFYATSICIIAFYMQFKLKRSIFSILGISIVLGIVVKVLT